MGYYRKFIMGYVAITALMEKLLKKDVVFNWSPKCQGRFDTLKGKLDLSPILVFPDWNKEFHMDVDASSIALKVVVA